MDKFNYFKKEKDTDILKNIADEATRKRINQEMSVADMQSFPEIKNDSIVNEMEVKSFQKIFDSKKESIDDEIVNLEIELALIDIKLQISGDHLSGVELKKIKSYDEEIAQYQEEAIKHIKDNPEDPEIYLIIQQLKFYKDKREKLKMILDSDMRIVTPEKQDELIEERKECLKSIELLKNKKESTNASLN